MLILLLAATQIEARENFKSGFVLIHLNMVHMLMCKGMFTYNDVWV
jgi:hypothetical protein